MEIKRCFDLLELDVNATLEDVRHAYKSQVKKYHPDRVIGDEAQKRRAEEKLKDINLAYEKVRSSLFAGQERTTESRKSPSTQTRPESGFENASGKSRSAGQESRPAFDARAERKAFFSWLRGKLRQFDFGAVFRARDSSSRASVKSERVFRRKSAGFRDVLREVQRRGGDAGRGRANAGGRGRGTRRACRGGNRNWQNPWQQYARRRRFHKSETGPVSAIRPVSRVRGVGRD